MKSKVVKFIILIAIVLVVYRGSLYFLIYFFPDGTILDDYPLVRAVLWIIAILGLLYNFARDIKNKRK